MKYSKLLFPNFLNKCITLSYDDGVKQDIRFCEILKKYGLKCTFNINSGQFGKTETDGRLTKKQVLSLYNDKDFEVAVHGSQHLDLTQEAKATAIKDVVTDKDTLENLFNRVILGMAYAFGTYNQEVVEILQNCDIKYSRTTISTNTFALPEVDVNENIENPNSTPTSSIIPTLGVPATTVGAKIDAGDVHEPSPTEKIR